MATDPLEQHLLEALNETPILDAHTHLVGGRLGARGLHDILLYHMAVSELYAAGCPSGARLTQYPGWPDTAEAHRRIEEALPYLDRARNTSISWGIRMILKDLYGWIDPVTPDNWRKLDALIRERADDRAWHREIVQRAGIGRICTEISRREQGQDEGDHGRKEDPRDNTTLSRLSLTKRSATAIITIIVARLSRMEERRKVAKPIVRRRTRFFRVVILSVRKRNPSWLSIISTMVMAPMRKIMISAIGANCSEMTSWIWVPIVPDKATRVQRIAADARAMADLSKRSTCSKAMST